MGAGISGTTGLLTTTHVVVVYTTEITSSYEAFHMSCEVVFPIIPA